MTGILLGPADRQGRLDHYRRSAGPGIRLRAHVLPPLDAGHPRATASAVLSCSPGTISRWQRRFETGGVGAAVGRPRGRRRSGVHAWAVAAVRWVLTLAPADFRVARGRWSCAAVAVVRRDDDRVAVGRETVRRWLRDAGRGWRRPRPAIRPKGPDREATVAEVRPLLTRVPAAAAAASTDAVDVDLPPRVGCPWVRRGQQAPVETPGTSEERSLAGRIHRRTGRVVLTEGKPKGGGAGLSAPGRRAAGAPARHGGPRHLRRRRVPHAGRGRGGPGGPGRVARAGGAARPPGPRPGH